jgi:hypothetical protein
MPLWLPLEVAVRIFMNQYSYENADCDEQIYDHYADDQRFRVGVEVAPLTVAVHPLSELSL